MDNRDFKFDISEPTEKFKKHLDVKFNERIILSAPFGAGKTCFLKEFFKDNDDKYEVIHLFPVNYSVATNEDIFELIKYDILFELFGKPIEFEKIDFSVFDYLPFYLKNNKKSLAKIFTPLISLIPETGKPIGSFVDRLFDFTEDLYKHYSKVKIDDKNKAQEYLENFTEKIGSIYEENFYTQLICELIGQLKNSNKETILIIDDLDRIDPEHIFRILNVLSAHIDVGKGENKFDFDKIILVFDQNNVRNIFRNKYGADVDYTGYIDKFYSYEIFEFSNVTGLEKDIYKIINSLKIRNSLLLQEDNNWYVEAVTSICKKIIITNKLTTRKLLKAYNKPFNSDILQAPFHEISKRNNINQFFIISIAQILLLIIEDWEELLSTLKKILYVNDYTNAVYLKTTKLLLEECILLLDYKTHNFIVDKEFQYNSSMFDFKISYDLFEIPRERKFYCNIKDEEINLNNNPKYLEILYLTLQMIHDKNILIRNI